MVRRGEEMKERKMEVGEGGRSREVGGGGRRQEVEEGGR